MTYAVTLDGNQRVQELFYANAAPQGAVPVTNEAAETLRTVSRFADWKYINGALVNDPITETMAQTQARLTALIQSHIDATARSRNYDSALSCVSYVNSTVPQFAAEAAAMVEWRDACWITAVTVLGQILANQIPVPTEAEAIAALPPMVWPA